MKRLRFLVCALLIMMLSTTTTFAANGPNGDSGDKDEPGYYPSKEDEARSAKKQKKANAYYKKNVSTIKKAAKGKKNFYKCNLTPVRQAKSYYCGPAMVKAMVKCMKGKANSQDYYADYMGTTTDGTNMRKVAKCLRNKAWKSYVYADIGSQSNFKKCIYHNISAYMRSGPKKRVPTALDIKGTTKTWFYQTDGHFIPVSGMRSDTKVVRVSDSFLTSDEKKKAKDPKKGKHRVVTTAKAYNVTKAHDRHAMIW